jgi:hypothetical protein
MRDDFTVDDVIALVRAEFQRRATEREADLARRMYRKGYLAGRSSQKRGQVQVTNPERHARGDDRRLLNG